MTDKELVQASLKGNRQAYGQIVQRYQSLVCAIAYNATGNVTQSEDIAQETFVAAWQRLGQIHDLAKFRSWLCQIARNLALLAIRKDKRNPITNAQEMDVLSSHPVSETTPRDDAISEEEQNLLWGAIEKIPEGYRIPLILYYREGQSVLRVAQTLGLNPNNVKQRLHRGRQMVRDEMAEFVESRLALTRPKRNMAPAVLALLPSARMGLVATAIGGARQFLVGVCSGSPIHIATVVGSVLLVVSGGMFFLPHSSKAGIVETPVRLASAPISERESLPEPTPDNTSESITPVVEDDVVIEEVAQPAIQEKTEEQLRMERIDLAKAELEKTWQDPSKKGTFSCLKGWAYLAMMGDDYAYKRLKDLFLNPNKDAQSANFFMQKYLNDTTGQDYLVDLYSNDKEPFGKRIKAFDARFRFNAESTLNCRTWQKVGPIPTDIEAYYRNKYIESGYNGWATPSPIHWATEKSLPFIEDILMTYVYHHLPQDHSSPESNSTSRRGILRRSSSISFLPPKSGSGPPASSCLVRNCMAALKGIPGSDSIQLLREIATLEGAPPVLYRHASEYLYELGDESFAMDLAYKRIKESDLSNRMSCARLLAKMGEDSYVQMVRENLYNTDDAIRRQAYVILCELGDPSFIRPAAHDFSGSNNEPLGIHSILFADHRRMHSSDSQFLQQGMPNYMSEQMCGYLSTLASEAPYPRARHMGLAYLQSGSDDQLRRYGLPVARSVLREAPVWCPPAKKDPQNALVMNWRIQATKLNILLRVGDEHIQDQALAHVEAMYDSNSEESSRDILVHSLSGCRNPKLAPFFARVIRESPHAYIRIQAARSLLAAEAGVLPE